MSIVRRPLELFLLFASLSVLAVPVARAAGDADKPGGSISAPRPVGSFRAVAVRAPVEVRLRQTGREAVEVLADSRLQPLIETRVIEGRYGPTLEIALRKNAELPRESHVIVTVDLVNLRALSIQGSGDVSASGLATEELGVSISGSGDVHLAGLQADALAIAISGSGDFDATGRATRLTASISGSGDIDAKGLEADEVSVHIAGSGDASVHANKSLAVAIAGSGDVVYRGDARIASSIAGNGTVTRR